MKLEAENSNEPKKQPLLIADVMAMLPSVDDAGVIAVNVASNVRPKLTAVEWFFNELERQQYFIGNGVYQAFKQAKELEKEQIIETWHNGYNNQSPMIDEENCGEKYYNETFNQTES